MTYSQNTYPKQIVLNEDTLIAITSIQLKKANKIFANEAFLVDKMKLIKKELDYTMQELLLQENKVKELNSQCLEFIDEKLAQNKKIEGLNEKLIKQKAKSKRRGWSLVGTVVIIILLV